MNIILNKEDFLLPDEVVTIGELIAWQQLPTIGVAVAVNNRVIPKKEWESWKLCQGDKIALITAVCGG